MAVYAALTSLINLIHQIEHHPSPPISINKQQAKSLSEDATFLQEFLEGYRSPVAADSDEAYAAADMIESHIVDVIQMHRSTTTYHQNSNSGEESNPSVFNFFEFLMKAKTYGGKAEPPLSLYQDLGKVIEDMNSIKNDATQIKNEKTAVVEAHASAARGSPSRSSIMVGFDGVLLEILDKLTGGHNNRQVIPIVGMSGIGKTTLAKTVFGLSLVKEHFDICAWVTISQKYNTKEILCELLSQANRKGKEELSFLWAKMN